MDKVRVFVSSTCFDLSQIRRDLENFIEEMGYQPVLSDSKKIAIPHGFDTLEACKWLVRASDIFVLIIGGRYGHTEKKSGKSVTNIEYDTAIEAGMPVFIFVDKEVIGKIETYKTLATMVEACDLTVERMKTALGEKIEDHRVFEFLERISTNNEKKPWI